MGPAYDDYRYSDPDEDAEQIFDEDEGLFEDDYEDDSEDEIDDDV